MKLLFLPASHNFQRYNMDFLHAWDFQGNFTCKWRTHTLSVCGSRVSSPPPSAVPQKTHTPCLCEYAGNQHACYARERLTKCRVPTYLKFLYAQGDMKWNPHRYRGECLYVLLAPTIEYNPCERQGGKCTSTNSFNQKQISRRFCSH